MLTPVDPKSSIKLNFVKNDNQLIANTNPVIISTPLKLRHKQIENNNSFNNNKKNSLKKGSNKLINFNDAKLVIQHGSDQYQQDNLGKDNICKYSVIEAFNFFNYRQ